MFQRKFALLFISFASAAAISLWWFFSGAPTVRAVGARLAFSIVQITEGFGEDGFQDFTETKITAQKPDGSKSFLVNRTFRNGPSTHDSIEFRDIFDVASRKHSGIDPLTRSLTTRLLADPKIGEMTSKPSCEAGVTESEELFGYRVYKANEVLKLKNDHSVKIEKWLARELECFPLRIEATKFSGETAVARTITRTLSLNLGNPDSSLFQIPSGYIERSPSQVMMEHLRLGKTPSFHSSLAEAADRSYYQAR